MQRYFDVVQNRQGTAVVGATVTVYDANGNLAALYSNNSGAASSNPVYTNSDGEYAFYAANGTYSITIAQAGYATETKPGVVLFDPSDSSASNNVQFLQAGTGAQVRSVQSKLRDVVSVKDFGAVGDGVTDDTAAFDFTAASAKLSFITKPDVSYNFPVATNPKGAAWFVDPTTTFAQFSGNGNFALERGTRQDQADGANIWRFTDRVFVGDAAARLTGNDQASDNGANVSWFGNTANYAGYLGRNGKLVVSSSSIYANSIGNDIPYGICVGIRGSDTAQEAIGVASHVVTSAAGVGWGFIAELQNEANVQCIGIEIAAKNKASLDTTLTPNAQTTGVFGVWLAGGGDATFGGAPTNPSTAGIAFVKGASTWNSGIVFMADALTSGRAISLSSQGVGGNHYFEWVNTAGNSVFAFTSNRTVATASQLNSSNSGLIYSIDNTAVFSADRAAPNSVNGISVFSDVSGAAPKIQATGSDANIDLFFVPKGTGLVRYGTYTGTGDVACNGYIEIKDAAGNVRKLMTTA